MKRVKEENSLWSKILMFVHSSRTSSCLKPTAHASVHVPLKRRTTSQFLHCDMCQNYGQHPGFWNIVWNCSLPSHQQLLQTLTSSTTALTVPCTDSVTRMPCSSNRPSDFINAMEFSRFSFAVVP